jgi:Na+-transporting methylmalonyl-CoA/oxaloacetate decarboxylase gamma subunit
METDILTSLQITFLGMGLVFLAILLIWILISGLTAVGTIRKPDPDLSQERGRKQKAAALAVALVIAMHRDKQVKTFALPPTAIVSAWQLSLRTNQMKKSGRFNE